MKFLQVKQTISTSESTPCGDTFFESDSLHPAAKLDGNATYVNYVDRVVTFFRAFGAPASPTDSAFPCLMPRSPRPDINHLEDDLEPSSEGLL
ncbi:hypothetical protein V6N13_146294 [Hibiscus sabdariffa]